MGKYSPSSVSADQMCPQPLPVRNFLIRDREECGKLEMWFQMSNQNKTEFRIKKKNQCILTEICQMSQKNRSVTPEAWEEETGPLRAGEGIEPPGVTTHLSSPVSPCEAPLPLLLRDWWGTRSQGPAQAACPGGSKTPRLSQKLFAFGGYEPVESEWGCGGQDVSGGTVLLGERFQMSSTESRDWGSHPPW